MNKSNKNATQRRCRGRDQDSLYADKAPPDCEDGTFPSVPGIKGSPMQRQRCGRDGPSSICPVLSFPPLPPLSSPFISTVTFSGHRPSRRRGSSGGVSIRVFSWARGNALNAPQAAGPPTFCKDRSVSGPPEQLPPPAPPRDKSVQPPRRETLRGSWKETGGELSKGKQRTLQCKCPFLSFSRRVGNA